MIGFSTLKFALTNPAMGKKLLKNKLESAIRAHVSYHQAQVSADTAMDIIFAGFLLPVRSHSAAARAHRSLRDRTRKARTSLQRKPVPP